MLLPLRATVRGRAAGQASEPCTGVAREGTLQIRSDLLDVLSAGWSSHKESQQHKSRTLAGGPRLRLAVAVLSIWLAWSASDPEAPPPPTPRLLQLSSSREIVVPPFAAWGERQCSASGNLFFHADTGLYNDSVIIELSSDGTKFALYELPADRAKGTAFGAFSVTPSGGLYLVVETRDVGTRVFHFSSDGKLSSEVRVEAPEFFLPKSLLAFESGRMLVGGYYSRLASPKLQGKSFFGIFEPSGKLLAQLSESGADVDMATTASIPSQGAITLGPDGNAYILKSSEIVVLSESGTVVRRVAYKKPDAHAIANWIMVSDNLIAIWLFTRGKDDVAVASYLVLDYETGEPFALYAPAEELGNNALCFSRQDGFTFLRSVDGRFRLLRAALK